MSEKEIRTDPAQIEWLVAIGAAREIWEQHEHTGEDDWIYGLLEWLDLNEDQTILLDAISAGHTIADASRLAGQNPEWGRQQMRRIRQRVTEIPY